MVAPELSTVAEPWAAPSHAPREDEGDDEEYMAYLHSNAVERNDGVVPLTGGLTKVWGRQLISQVTFPTVYVRVGDAERIAKWKAVRR